MAITTVLFDLDGTLLPMDQDSFVKGYMKMLAAKMYRGIGRKWINDNLCGGMSPEEIVSRLGEKAEGVTPSQYRREFLEGAR